MKESRQKMIVELINEFEIETQEELSRLLLERGYVTTQATISRDIKDLNIKRFRERTAGQNMPYRQCQEKQDRTAVILLL